MSGIESATRVKRASTGDSQQRTQESSSSGYTHKLNHEGVLVTLQGDNCDSGTAFTDVTETEVLDYIVLRQVLLHPAP